MIPKVHVFFSGVIHFLLSEFCIAFVLILHINFVLTPFLRTLTRINFAPAVFLTLANFTAATAQDV